MALIGGGMLVELTNIAAGAETEFARWHDRERLATLARLPGALNARRARARRAERRCLLLVEAARIEDFAAPAWRAAEARPSEIGRRMAAAMESPLRMVCDISASYGHGRGGGLALIRLTPPTEDEARRLLLIVAAERLRRIAALDGVVAAHLLAADPDLSPPAPNADPHDDVSGDWVLLVEGSDEMRLSAAIGEELAGQDLAGRGARRVTRPSFFRLVMDLHRDEAAEIRLEPS